MLTSLSMYHSIASDAGLSLLVGALKTNTTLKSMRVSLSEPEPPHLLVVQAEALAINQTLTVLEGFFGVISRFAAWFAVRMGVGRGGAWSKGALPDKRCGTGFR